MKPSEIKFYLEALKSDGCQCGRTKKRGMAVCYTCWKRLPRDLQQQLYWRIGDGFEEAYDAAIAYLGD